jgi:hypothetical protein
MYAALWRVLPGPLWVRILILVALAVAVLFALVEWVFPVVDHLLNSNNSGTVAT